MPDQASLIEAHIPGLRRFALALLRGETDLLVLGVDAERLSSIAVDARLPDKSWVAFAPPRPAAGLEVTSAGISVPLAWPAAASVEQIRIRLAPRDASARMRIRHIALLPPALR